MNRKKNRFKKIFMIFIIILGISGISVGLGDYFYYNPTFSEEREPKKFFWLNFSDRAQSVLEKNYEEIDMISPYWYVLNYDGSLNFSRIWNGGQVSEHLAVLNICAKYNISVHPMITGGNQENMHALLESSYKQQLFLKNLTNLLEIFDFNGFNIDFEGVYENQREEFNSFFSSIKDTIGVNKTLSIAVPAKIKDNKGGWDGWCDYATIGKIADMLMIMTYDEHARWTEPGNIASISWVNKVLAYATRVVPLEKIYAGIPRYGYNWIPDDPNWPNWGYEFSFFEEKYENYGGTITRSEDGNEVILKFTDENGYENICYYTDAETTRTKELFLSKYPIGGYCYWYLTGGDPEYFN